MCSEALLSLPSAFKPLRLAKTEQPPVPRKPIGFRGNHRHHKKLYDPVYPTTKIPGCFIPRYKRDWRNAGRALLCVGLQYLEDYVKTPKTHTACIRYMKGGFCSERCMNACSNNKWRCLCCWRVVGSVYDLINKMDGLLNEYKGEIATDKPLFRTPNYVATRNRYRSEAMRYNEETGKYEYCERDPKLLSAFGISDNEVTTTSKQKFFNSNTHRRHIDSSTPISNYDDSTYRKYIKNDAKVGKW